MPTASTSQILGNNECFEPYTSNLYVRRTLAGEFVCVSKHLLRDLIKLGLWTPALKNKLIAHNGSVQGLTELPEALRELYKTVWEMKGKTLIDMAADRGAFIDQSQSLNVHMIDVSYAKMTSMHFYAWKRGLKTGMYYLRTKSAVDAIKFTVDQELLREENKKAQPQNVFEDTRTSFKREKMEPDLVAKVKEEIKKTGSKEGFSFSDSEQSDNETPSSSSPASTPLKQKTHNFEGRDEDAIQREKLLKQREEAIICSLKNKDECLSCSS